MAGQQLGRAGQVESNPLNIEGLRQGLAKLPASVAVGSGRALTMAVEFATTIYLMRLLGPEPFGLVAMATGLLVAFSVFKDAGAGASLVSDKHLSNSRVGAAALIAFTFGMGTTLIGLACTPLVVRFYGEEELATIWVIVCLTLWLTSMSSIPTSLAQRRQRFWMMSWIPFLAAAGTAVVALAIARWRHDFWPILTFQVLGGVFGFALLWGLLRPRLSWPDKGDIKEVLKFGRGLIGFDALNVLNRYADNVIIGFFLGSHALGLYLLAYKVLMIPLREIGGLINTLAYPRLSRLAPDWGEVGGGLAQVMREVAMFATPLCLGVTLAAPELIGVVFGPAWMGALVPVQVLALLGIAQAPFAQIGLAYTVSRNTDEFARWGLLSTPAIILSFFAGIPWGIQGVAISYALTSAALLFPMLRIGARVLGISPWLLARGGCTGIGIGGLVALPLLATCLAARTAGLDDLYVLALTIAVGALSEAALYLFVIHRRRLQRAAW